MIWYERLFIGFGNNLIWKTFNVVFKVLMFVKQGEWQVTNGKCLKSQTSEWLKTQIISHTSVKSKEIRVDFCYILLEAKQYGRLHYDGRKPSVAWWKPYGLTQFADSRLERTPARAKLELAATALVVISWTIALHWRVHRSRAHSSRSFQFSVDVIS